MGIVVLPFFLMAIGAVLAIVDVATMGGSTSAMGHGAAGRGIPPSSRPDELPASTVRPPLYSSRSV